MVTTPANFVLASSSPRRRVLLEQLGFVFDCRSPEVDETPLPHETAADLVTRLATLKASSVATETGMAVVGADTVVVCDGDILGKPVDQTDAAAMLGLLSGRTHRVVSGVAVVDQSGTATTMVVETRVTMTQISAADISSYVSTGEPLDKAGSYSIQGAGGAFVESINGSYSNVVGLPLVETLELLQTVKHDG